MDLEMLSVRISRREGLRDGRTSRDAVVAGDSKAVTLQERPNLVARQDFRLEANVGSKFSRAIRQLIGSIPRHDLSPSRSARPCPFSFTAVWE